MESNSVMALMPIKEAGVTNILIGNKFVKFAYIIGNSSPLPFKNFFKVALTKENVTDFVTALASAVSLKDGAFSNVPAKTIINYLEEEMISNKSLNIIIPILNLVNKKSSIKNEMFGSLIEYPNTEIFNSEIRKLKDAINSNQVLHLDYENIQIFINGEQVDSPCTLCKLNKEKLGDLCMYKTNNYECLFNCEKALKEMLAEDTNHKQVNTDTLSIVNNFEEKLTSPKEYINNLEKEYYTEETTNE